MKVFQISIEVNKNSVGKIAEQIGEEILRNKGESYITYARSCLPSKSKTIKIGNRFDLYYHGVQTRLFDTHCLHSKRATNNLIKQIDKIAPDIIHLHHIHGYFIHMEILFNYLKKKNYPVVWTFHDCWSFTGHCAFFDTVDCNKWKTLCYDCELKKSYPASYLIDRSTKNFELKKKLFTSLDNLTIVPVSLWLQDLVKQSFLKDQKMELIKNGVDISVFDIFKSYSNGLENETRKILLGVASTWDERKGLNEFIKLDKLIDHSSYCITLVGLDNKQLAEIPKTIHGFPKTDNVTDLVSFYNQASIFVNPTKSDTYPTTNLEAIACGIPVVTYNTGGSPEAITPETGIVTNNKDAYSILEAINEIEKERSKGKFSKEVIRNYAIKNFNKQKQFNQYIDLYKKVIEKSQLT
ncbi:glycosyltransferase [Empedobacter falsenii]|uniref:glycosyltransferase n=1 Tax=Empedobacter falsenii TaxID=343874 RepID=UPI00056DC7DA|nr:glycosyltransferase [Empedobacter falsenii]